MWSFIVMTVAFAGEEAVGNRLARDVYYHSYPVDGYQPVQKVYYVNRKVALQPMPVETKHIRGSPPYYFKKQMDHYGEDSQKQYGHYDSDKAALLGKEDAAGLHHIIVDTTGGRGYNHGDITKASVAEDDVASGRLQAYGKASKLRYGGLGGAGSRRSHKTSGFRKSYRKDESGHDSRYDDEGDHLEGVRSEQSYDEVDGATGAGAASSAARGAVLRGHTDRESALQAAGGSSGADYTSEGSRVAAAHREGVSGAGHNSARYEPMY